MSSRRTYFVLLIAASVVLLVPFFVIEILPLQDYPNHLARIHILSHLENSPILRQYYAASWAPCRTWPWTSSFRCWRGYSRSK